MPVYKCIKCGKVHRDESDCEYQLKSEHDKVTFPGVRRDYPVPPAPAAARNEVESMKHGNFLGHNLAFWKQLLDDTRASGLLEHEERIASQNGEIDTLRQQLAAAAAALAITRKSNLEWMQCYIEKVRNLDAALAEANSDIRFNSNMLATQSDIARGMEERAMKAEARIAALEAALRNVG